MPRLQIEQNIEIYYEDDDFTDPWRSAPVMLLQHGFSRSGRFWYNWVPLLGREFRILRPDMRGMGRSTMPEGLYKPSLDTFASDVRRLLDRLGIEQVVFVGESFGGIIGLKFAHAYPGRTQALVLCNTPCRLPHGELRQRFAAGGDWDAAMRQGVGTWSTATIDMRLDTRIAPEELKKWYIAEMDRTSPTVARQLQAYLDTLDFRDHLKEITVPTLLLVGEETPTSPLDQQQFMAAQIPHCRLAVYPKLGHGINVLKPEWCAEQIREFLAASTNR
jgi:3-oxoadipate enol-lactonase